MHNHTIHKQKLILKVQTETGGYLFQTQVSELLQNSLRDDMELLFDAIIPSNAILRIDTLHLDLGTIDTSNFEQQFTERFLTKLEHALSNSKKAVTTPSQSLQETLYHFLQKGTLPWYSAVKNIRLWEEDIMRTFAAEDWSELFKWFNNNQENKLLIQRLVNQFSDSFLEMILLKSGAQKNSLYKQWMSDFKFIMQELQLQTTATRTEVWTSLLQVVLLDNDEKNVRRTISAILQLLKEQTTPARSIETNLSQLQPTQKTNTSKQQSSDSKKQNAQVEDLYVPNSGAVILHPFLQQYFQDLGLLQDKQFLNAASQQRAVLLLHYLATGETEAAEFNVMLLKILCGLPLEQTLPCKIELTENEIKESANLLHAVTEHWPPLRNTSIEGLRTTFFQRDGKLQAVENGWRLTVEQKTVDILLGKLPWGFSTIRLSWMQNSLNVDWC